MDDLTGEWWCCHMVWLWQFCRWRNFLMDNHLVVHCSPFVFSSVVFLSWQTEMVCVLKWINFHMQPTNCKHCTSWRLGCHLIAWTKRANWKPSSSTKMHEQIYALQVYGLVWTMIQSYHWKSRGNRRTKIDIIIFDEFTRRCVMSNNNNDVDNKIPSNKMDTKYGIQTWINKSSSWCWWWWSCHPMRGKFVRTHTHTLAANNNEWYNSYNNKT